MGRTFIPCGIDHGTSNSAIAVMEKNGPRVIKPDGINPVLPSAVYYSNRGRLLIGHAAIQAMLMEPDGGIGYTGYKIRLGHDDRYEFPGGKVLAVPELGGIVINELMRAYRDDGNPDYGAAVVTVPAKWEQPACAATLKAAECAGLTFAQTLMEPVAAALAYGFTAEDKNVKWMVFDLGGGTLDISLMVIRNGRCTPLPEGNAGDVLLGGRKFDRELLDFVLGPRKVDPQYNIKMETHRKLDPDYRPLREQYSLEDLPQEMRRSAWGMLSLAVERGKIELSEKERTVIRCPQPFEDSAKQLVKVEFPIERSAYERLIASDVERAVITCRNLLDKNRLRPSDVQRIILIGGPSKTPYVQQVLRDRLGIPLESRIDPMTAVAQGAAIFAATVEIPSDKLPTPKKPPLPSELGVDLKYASFSNVPICPVMGRIQGDGQPWNGWMVEIKRKDGLWSSGLVPIDETGLFEADVSLIQASGPTLSEFETRILDAGGHAVVTCDEPRIWHPYASADDVLPSHLMVGLHDNGTEILLQQGVRLPAEKTGEYVTVSRLRRGHDEDVLVIPVLEGLEHFFGAVDPHGDANLKVGELRILGTELSNDLPAGSLVEVTLQRDRNRQITVQASVRSVGGKYEAEFMGALNDPPAEEMTREFARRRLLLQAVERIDAESPTPTVTERLQQIREQEVIAQIERNLERTKEDDRECQSRCYRDILRLTGAVHHLEDLQVGPRLRRFFHVLQRTLTGSDAEELKAIGAELEQALDRGDKMALDSIENSLKRLYYTVRLRVLCDLIRDVNTFPRSFRGTPPQLNAYNDAYRVASRMNDEDLRGEIITDEELQEANRVRQELWRHWVRELGQWPAPAPGAEGIWLSQR